MFYPEKMTKYLQLIFLMTVIGRHTEEHITNNNNGKEELFLLHCHWCLIEEKIKIPLIIDFVYRTCFFSFLVYFLWGLVVGFQYRVEKKIFSKF